MKIINELFENYYKTRNFIQTYGPIIFQLVSKIEREYYLYQNVYSKRENRHLFNNLMITQRYEFSYYKENVFIKRLNVFDHFHGTERYCEKKL